MPQRHSKNAGSHTYGVFSYKEREKCEFMQKEEARLGVDSQLPFGHCWLSLAPAVDPVVTPSGHTYSREAILEHMASRSQDLKRRRDEWEAQERQAARAEARATEQRRLDEATAFEAANDPTAKKPSSSVAASSSRALVVVAATTTEEPKTEPTSALREVGKPDAMFWLPQHAPEISQRRRLEEPPKRPPSPITGTPLRMKDLVSLPLTRADSKKARGGDDVRFLCHVSGDEITTQPVIFIRTTGCILLKAVADRLDILNTHICPITGRSFKSKDVIPLVSGTSAYAASGGTDLVVKKYRPTGGGA